MKDISYTEAQIKGRRLRMARALTGLSRQAFHEKTGITTLAMDTWESGRIELNEKSAFKLCESFRQLEIFCSIEWLLRGEGLPPHIMSITEKTMFAYNHTAEDINDTTSLEPSYPVLPPSLNDDIKKELSFFLNLHEGSVFLIVKETLSNQSLNPGDCVAGLENEPTNLLGNVIILRNSKDQLLLCKLHNLDKNIAEISLNSYGPPINVIFKKTYRIVWHRKP